MPSQCDVDGFAGDAVLSSRLMALLFQPYTLMITKFSILMYDLITLTTKTMPTFHTSPHLQALLTSITSLNLLLLSIAFYHPCTYVMTIMLGMVDTFLTQDPPAAGREVKISIDGSFAELTSLGCFLHINLLLSLGNFISINSILYIKYLILIDHKWFIAFSLFVCFIRDRIGLNFSSFVSWRI